LKINEERFMVNLEIGDHVEWNSSGGNSHGKVTEKVTHDTSIKGHRVKASQASPQFEVVSDKSGKKAVHRPGSLKKD
jgi:N-methylhydantoinase B/oxoprolinase/acetone carboxylase alpha subunit